MTWWYSLVSLLPFEWAAPGTMLFMKTALLGILVLCPLPSAAPARCSDPVRKSGAFAGAPEGKTVKEGCK